MNLLIMSLEVPQHLQQYLQNINQNTKQVVNNSIHSLAEKTQQASSSVRQITTETKTKAIDSVKGSLEQIQQSTSTAIQTSVNSSVNDWLQQHPVIYQLVKFLGWASNHPIWGVVLILLVIAIAWSLIRALVRLIESASLSILKTPIKVIWLISNYIWQLLRKFTISNWNNLKNTNQAEIIPLIDVNPNIVKDKQTRLAEISVRLTKIQNEQNELLAEAAELLKSKENQNHYIEIYPVKNEIYKDVMQ